MCHTIMSNIQHTLEMGVNSEQTELISTHVILMKINTIKSSIPITWMYLFFKVKVLQFSPN